MPDKNIEEFAKILVEQVRDLAIRENDIGLRSNAQSYVASRWKELFQNEISVEAAREIIPEIVDVAVFHLLRAIDGGQLKLLFTASNGEIVDLTEDGLGELAGWYAGIPGWRSKYSKERYIDDLADLRTWVWDGTRFRKPE